MEMSFRTVFDTPKYMDEVEPTGEKWESEAFESFCDTHKTQIEFLVEARQSTKQLIEEKSFTEDRWETHISKIRTVEDDVYYHAETYVYKDWSINLRTMWHKFWYSL
jgi:hypothetical protein